MALPARLAFVDVETTGAQPVRDRVTEIAIIRVEDGGEVRRWQSLVNPGMSIPYMIQSLIGITDDMVADAPPFAAIAATVRELLDGCVLVAHNARFDYGFLVNEFKRLDADFDAEVLCTVKFSRALYPQHHRHGLDALIERHGLRCDARHRAMGDTEAVWQFVRQAVAESSAEALAAAVRKAMKAPSRPPGLPAGAIEGVPEGPGVYLFFGEGELPLYIGKSVSLRTRVMDHFSAAQRNGKDARLAREVRRVGWIETAGELGALLLEAELVKARQPLHNRQLRANEEVFALRLLSTRTRAAVLQRVRIGGSDPAGWEALHGVFRSRQEANALLHQLALSYRLCPRRLGLEQGGSGACMACQMKRCAGVCAGRESAAEHDARLLAGLAAVSVKPWPWPAAALIEELCAHSGRRAWHVIDHWCLLGSAATEAELEVLLATRPPRAFDADVYRILARWLERPEHLQAVQPLCASS